MPTIHERTSLLTLLLLIASATGHAQTAEIDPDWPEWLQDFMQREAGALQMATMETDDGNYRFRLPGTAQHLATKEGPWTYSIDIGSGMPIACYLYTEDLPMTEMVVRVGELAIENLMSTSNVDQESARQIYHLDAGPLDGKVFVALEWLSRFPGKGGDIIGHTKIRAATNGEILQLCWHSEVGYRDTIDTIFTAFVESLQYNTGFAAPFAEDITVDTTNGSTTGATYTSLAITENGEFQSYSYTTSILPVAPGEIQYSDSYYTEYSGPDGRIVDSYVYSVDNGEVTMDLTLERDAPGDSDNWIVSGEFQGTDVEFEIPPNDALRDEITLLKDTRQFYAGDDETLETLVWAPYLDPTVFMPLTLTRDDDEVPRQGILRIGPLDMTIVVDEFGSVTRGSMTIGPNTIEFERAWSRGDPVPPTGRKEK